ncbi:MAG TPA: phage holin family protein [Acidimicrobiia bacterium]|jgi:putative membrane protein|nr:phage holin family protein [Acidimicrobiia bacterium]
MGLILNLLATAASLWVAVWLIDGFEFDGQWWQFIIIALILGIANAVVKPILKILSLPLVILTLGLFLLVVNAIVLQIVVWLSGVFELGLTSTGFFWATFLASIVVSIAAWLIGAILPDD